MCSIAQQATLHPHPLRLMVVYKVARDCVDEKGRA